MYKRLAFTTIPATTDPRGCGRPSGEQLLRAADAGGEAVDLLGDGVEVEARAVRRSDAELAHKRLAAVVPGADGDSVLVEHLRDVVRVHVAEVEADDPGAPLRRRPVERDAGDLAELLERVGGERMLVLLDRFQPDPLQVVDRGAEADGLPH